MSAFLQIVFGYLVGKLIGELIALLLVIAFLWKAARR